MTSHVHITKCDGYTYDILKQQLEEHMKRYPDLDDLKGKRVLLKLNLLSATEPDRAVTTHPEFTRALVDVIKERGGHVIIGDSPGGIFTKGTLKRIYDETGIERVAADTGAELNFITSSHNESFPEGHFVKTFNICDYIRNADIIIAVPKIKTHMFTGLTCASKVMFGAIPGTEKVKYHTRFPDTVDFSKMLHDLTDLCGVDLFIVDGIIGMEGKGPSKGEPRKIGVIISGKDSTVIDLHVSRMSGLDPMKLPIMRAAFDTGRLIPDEEIELSGNGNDLILDPALRPARGGHIFTNPPRFLKRFIINLSTSRPKISVKNCTGCGVCRDNCAGEAIRIINGKARISYSRCIRCYCCHELCPHDAVYMSIKESGLASYIEDMSYRYFIR